MLLREGDEGDKDNKEGSEDDDNYGEDEGQEAE